MDKENVVNSYVTLDWNIKYGTFLSLKKKKKNEILPCVTTWMNLEDIVLNEINQAQKDKCNMIPLLGYIQKVVKCIYREWNGAHFWLGEDWGLTVQ